ncbi:hypothetical protein [Microcystis phage Mae-JY24]
MSVIVTGDQILRLRMLSNPPMNQSELARAIGVSRQLVSLMEKGLRTVTPEAESAIRNAYPDAYRVVTSAINEARAAYTAPRSREVVDFLADFLADPQDPSLKTRARDLLKGLL